MEKLVGTVLLAFFGMLIFSNFLITLSTSYIGRDSEFLMSFHFTRRTLYLLKFTESVFYSSWAFAVLSLPMFAMYGVSKGAPLGFYPFAALMALSFLIIPAGIGALFTLVFCAILPARKARGWSLGFMIGGVAVVILLVRGMGLRELVRDDEFQDFAAVMGYLNMGNLPILPNFWFSRGLMAASAGNWRETSYWLLCLSSSAAMVVQVLIWLVPRFYYRGWSLARESATATGATVRWWNPLTNLDRGLRFFGAPMAAIITKDVRTFFRDFSQWSQLVLLFGLMAMYVANIRGMGRNLGGIDRFVQHWPTVLSFFNLGATCFVICILTTRFVYPLLSLEGKQYWVVGLAPFPKRQLIYEKYWMCVITTCLVSLSLIAFSNHMLDVTATMAMVALITVFVLCLGLSSLAVGLGAIFPNFRQDNPSAIANGLGGTLNVVISIAYIAITLGSIVYPTIMLVASLESGLSTWEAIAQTLRRGWHSLLLCALVQLFMITVPLWIGVRRWERLEIHL